MKCEPKARPRVPHGDAQPRLVKLTIQHHPPPPRGSRHVGIFAFHLPAGPYVTLPRKLLVVLGPETDPQGRTRCQGFGRLRPNRASAPLESREAWVDPAPAQPAQVQLTRAAAALLGLAQQNVPARVAEVANPQPLAAQIFKQVVTATSTCPMAYVKARYLLLPGMPLDGGLLDSVDVLLRVNVDDTNDPSPYIIVRAGEGGSLDLSPDGPGGQLVPTDHLRYVLDGGLIEALPASVIEAGRGTLGDADDIVVAELRRGVFD